MYYWEQFPIFKTITMMDTQDTNLPLEEGKLEEEKKAAEVTDSATTPAEEVLNSEEKTPSETPMVDNDAKAVEEAAEPVAEKVEEPASEDNIPVTEKEEEKPAEKEEETAVETKSADLEEPSEEDEEATEDDKKPLYFHSTEEVIGRLKEIAEGDCQVSKQELDGLKQAFYKLHLAKQEEAKKKFIEDGGAENDFVPVPDEQENDFKEIMSVIKNKRTQNAAELEKEKEKNLTIKLSIIDKLKEMVESPDEANHSYTQIKKLQQEWNASNPIPQEKANELWKNYQLYSEKFYDILKLNNEFREYDFKKNLAIKTRLCEIAEKLSEEPDIISAFHQLQKLHQEFRDTGPVAKDLREAIWQRFKAASTAINRKHQQHFDSLKEEEIHNLDQKTVICEIIESTEWDKLKSFSSWEQKTQEIIALQKKWKTIGFVPKKQNASIFERFRKDCDDFFKRKGEYFKGLKENMNANLAKKRELIKKAEELKESTDWKTTADILSNLQKEWKTVGPVSKKYSDSIWKQFIGACDYFFDQKNKANNSQHSAEVQNLEAKKDIISKLDGIDENTSSDEANSLVHELIEKWNTIGHVPFKEKDKIYEKFHSKVNEIFSKFNISAASKNIDNFKTAMASNGSAQGLLRERDKLIRSFDIMKNELQTYENNLGFFSTSTESGNNLVTEMNKKVEKLKAELELAKEKIKIINDQISQQQDEEKK
jgi:pterin-4a-carbinolamine dehydratase